MRKRLRYADLLELGIVTNRVTLSNWIRHRDFPTGQLRAARARASAWRPPPPENTDAARRFADGIGIFTEAAGLRDMTLQVAVPRVRLPTPPPPAA